MPDSRTEPRNATRERPGRLALRDALVSAVMVAVMAAEVLFLYTGWPGARSAAHGAVLALLPLGFHRFGGREYYLLVLCVILTLLTGWLHPEPIVALRSALDQAAFLLAFILLLGLLQEGAFSSPSVSACGLFLSRQPSGRRYFALFSGAHIMGVVFNLGAVSLLAPLVRRGLERGLELSGAADPYAPIKERRQLSALLRGFAWMVIWSPTAVAPIVLLALIPGIDRGRWFLLGFMIAAVMLLVGWLEDRVRWRRVRRQALAAGYSAGQAMAFPARAFGNFALVCLCLALLTLALIRGADVTIVAGLMLAAPSLLLGWLLAQNRDKGPAALAATRDRVAEILRAGLPASLPVAVTLGCSGYVGRAAAVLIPAETLAAAVNLDAWPGYLFLTGLSVSVAVIGQLALSPIMMAVFFGSVLGALPALPVDPTLAALAIACGWSLSMTASPFASVVLLTARVTGHTGATLTWRWNLTFSFLAAGTLLVIFYALTGGA